jgi:hypothetical protein
MINKPERGRKEERQRNLVFTRDAFHVIKRPTP